MLTSKELAWAAGFLEGDGCFVKQNGHRGPHITAGQKQKEPLERLQQYFGGTITLQRKGEPWEIWCWSLHGYMGIGLMMTLYIFMSPNRKATILKALEQWKARPSHQKNRYTCPYGHPYDEVNTYRHSQGRGCRTCRTARAKTEASRQVQKVYYRQNRERILAVMRAKRRARKVMDEGKQCMF